MTINEAMAARHSVRSYTDKPIGPEEVAALKQAIDEANAEGGLNMQLCLEAPDAFSGLKAKYGKFRNARNYIAIVGKDDGDFPRRGGYYGEKVLLQATMLGLDSCWVAGTYSKNRVIAQVDRGESMLMVITLGYGTDHGAPRKGKPMDKLCTVSGEMPDWFRSGMEAVLLAPSAMNQRRYHFTLRGTAVHASAGVGLYTNTDLGIAQYHFEVGAGDTKVSWLY